MTDPKPTAIIVERASDGTPRYVEVTSHVEGDEPGLFRFESQRATDIACDWCGRHQLADGWWVGGGGGAFADQWLCTSCIADAIERGAESRRSAGMRPVVTSWGWAPGESMEYVSLTKEQSAGHSCEEASESSCSGPLMAGGLEWRDGVEVAMGPFICLSHLVSSLASCIGDSHSNVRQFLVQSID